MNDIALFGIDNIQKIDCDKFGHDFWVIINGKIYKSISFAANALCYNILNVIEENICISN